MSDLQQRFEQLNDLLEQRIVFLDGAMGTMIQGYDLAEADYRGDRFADSEIELKGNHDLLSITRADIIREIHTEFLNAGADVIETNSFNSTAPALADYGLETCVAELNLASAQLSRSVADEVGEATNLTQASLQLIQFATRTGAIA